MSSKMYEVQEIVSFMENVCASNTHSNYHIIAKKYIDLCVIESLRGLSKASDVEEDNVVDFHISGIKDKIRNRYNRTQYWYPLLRDNFPFYYTIQRGWRNNDVSVLSTVKLVFSPDTLIDYRIQHDFSEHLATLLSDGLTVSTPIDTQSLERYCNNTWIALRSGRYANGKRKLIRYINSGLNILDLAKQSSGVLHQGYTVSDFGRTYLSGINLQNAPSVVREAALGNCYKYDIRTSVYGYMLDVLTAETHRQGITFNARASYMWDYISNKSHWRNRLAEDCLRNTNTTPQHKQKIIKQCLTAIGFGANVSVRGAISDIIYHAQDRELFANHPFLVGLVDEVNAFREICRSQLPAAKAELGDIIKKNGRSSLSKLCSWFYQQQERAVIEAALQFVGEQNVLLVVHDCVYTLKPIELWDLNQVASGISNSMQFESEKIKRIDYDAVQNAEHAQAKQQHQQRIQAEEVRAHELL